MIVVRGTHGEKSVPTYEVDLVLPNRVTVPDLTVAEAIGLAGSGDVLIRMDLMSMDNFVVGTWRGKTSFSFQCPAENRVDVLPIRQRGNVDCAPPNN